MVTCRDVHCSDESHKVACDDHMLEILGCIEKAANECLPLHNSEVGNRHKNVIPRWNHDIKSFQEDAHFWHSIWQSAGRSLNCELPFTHEENTQFVSSSYTKKQKDAG